MDRCAAGHAMIRRYSSRRFPLDTGFLNDRLQGATSYDRIAGYFSSSILEIAGEALRAVASKVRVVCNSQLTQADAVAIRQEWCGSRPEDLGEAARPRFQLLHELLSSGKLEVRVLPDNAFGLVHGKAGVITYADGKRTSFIGSANESGTAFTLNYELIWEDPSSEAVEWVQAEFAALWESSLAEPLGDFVVQDLGRLAQRRLVATVDDWVTGDSDPASVAVESPVCRDEVGLWEHQKHFVKQAFEAHCGPHGARLVLADQVGLGKTLQLAMAAQLMALVGDRPVLVLAPKALVWQWQDEIATLLGIPSAVWDAGAWHDERGVKHPGTDRSFVKRCPRRIGIVSTGLITAGSEEAGHLAGMRYECVVLDEAHRARRRNFGRRAHERADRNRLLEFMTGVSARTKSLLLATATPVQLHPVEAYDLLDLLSVSSDSVLGSGASRWRHSKTSLDLVMEREPPPPEFDERWDWMRNPFPPRSEHRDFHILRDQLGLSDEAPYARGNLINQLGSPERQRINDVFPRFLKHHNPYLRHIVLRTRKYLEETTNPATGEPYLKPVGVRLHGEAQGEQIELPPFLLEAYRGAERYCEVLQQGTAKGFRRTMLLRRIGSTMEAGRISTMKLLGSTDDTGADREQEEVGRTRTAPTDAERRILERVAHLLKHHRKHDPKYAAVRERLEDGWLDLGCIVFSQFYDSVWWLASKLASDLPREPIGIYSRASRSGVLLADRFRALARDDLKAMVGRGEVRLMVGTEAASEGLNLQRLGTLINLDLPWTPSRLEQRKGRIQRIGQRRSVVDVYNMRYAGSVEDRVHQLLSERMQGITDLFGQLPDTLEDVWVQVALGEVEKAKQTIDAVPRQHPFELRYKEVNPVDWESCTRVLADSARRTHLAQGWR